MSIWEFAIILNFFFRQQWMEPLFLLGISIWSDFALEEVMRTIQIHILRLFFEKRLEIILRGLDRLEAQSSLLKQRLYRQRVFSGFRIGSKECSEVIDDIAEVLVQISRLRKEKYFSQRILELNFQDELDTQVGVIYGSLVYEDISPYVYVQNLTELIQYLERKEMYEECGYILSLISSPSLDTSQEVA